MIFRFKEKKISNDCLRRGLSRSRWKITMLKRCFINYMGIKETVDFGINELVTQCSVRSGDNFRKISKLWQTVILFSIINSLGQLKYSKKIYCPMELRETLLFVVMNFPTTETTKKNRIKRQIEWTKYSLGKESMRGAWTLFCDSVLIDACPPMWNMQFVRLFVCLFVRSLARTARRNQSHSCANDGIGSFHSFTRSQRVKLWSHIKLLARYKFVDFSVSNRWKWSENTFTNV